MESRMKNFNIWAFTEKFDYQMRDFTKKPRKRRDCIKRGAWTTCRFKRGLSRKRGWCFLRLVLIPRCILCFLTKQKGKEGESKKGSRIVRLPPRALG